MIVFGKLRQANSPAWYNGRKTSSIERKVVNLTCRPRRAIVLKSSPGIKPPAVRRQQLRNSKINLNEPL